MHVVYYCTSMQLCRIRYAYYIFLQQSVKVSDKSLEVSNNETALYLIISLLFLCVVITGPVSPFV